MENRKILGLEAGRGIAAILVVLAHATGWAGAEPPFLGLFKAGTAGVDFFFVLSGFVIAYAHRHDIDQPAQLSRYVWRRITRIYPTWWMMLALATPLILIFPHSRDDISWSLEYVLQNLALWPLPGYPIISPGWSLQHEMLFYLLFAVAVANRALGVVVFAAWGAGIIWAIFADPPFPASFLFHIVNIEFFFGIAVALSGVRLGWRAVAIGSAIFFAGMVLQSQGWAEFAGHPILRRFLYGLSSALVIAGLAGLPIRARAAEWLGDISYPLYLLHYPLLYVLFRSGWVPTSAPSMLLQLLLCLAAAHAFNRYLERPLLGILRHPGRLPSRQPPRA